MTVVSKSPTLLLLSSVFLSSSLIPLLLYPTIPLLNGGKNLEATVFVKATD